MKARPVAVLIIMAIASSLAAYYTHLRMTVSEQQLVIFCAGSLYTPLKEVASIFEDRYEGVDVILEPSGSVMAVRKVVELERRCDVLAVADYRLIEELVMQRYANWCVAFASNEVVLAYLDHSKYADQINSDNWLEILLRPDVSYGLANPNDDPCGYRAVIVLSLASMYYEKPEALDELVVKASNIYVEEEGGRRHIYVPAALEVKSQRLVVRSKSVDLIALLEAGVLDYVFEYRSVATQHGLRFVKLPPELNLGDPGYSDFYTRAMVHIMHGTSRERKLEGSPIVYGVTIPSTAENKEEAAEFIKLLLSDVGREVFKELGHPFLKEPLFIGERPGWLRA